MTPLAAPSITGVSALGWVDGATDIASALYVDAQGNCFGLSSCPVTVRFATQGHYTWPFVLVDVAFQYGTGYALVGGTVQQSPAIAHGTYLIPAAQRSVTLSGTVRSTDCADTGCRAAPAPGVTLRVVSGAGIMVTKSSRTGAWSATVTAGSYSVTPVGGGFAPISRAGTANSNTTGLDFALCASLPTARASALSVRVFPASAGGACPDGLDWAMLGRTDEVPRIASVTHNGMIRPSDVYAPLSVFLNLTRGGVKVDTCSPTSVWSWSVTKKPSGAKVTHAPLPGCKSFMQVDTQGVYSVVARRTLRGSKSVRQTIRRTIDVRDVLIVGMGDSNGSGEGIPPFWFDQCNRGSASYQYQAASLLEQQSQRHASVTFVSASCSGGRTQHLYSTGYAGVNPAATMAPQLTQLSRATAPPRGRKRRTIDAAVISIGVNNIAFGPILAYCIEYHAAKAASDLARATAEPPPVTPDPLPWASCEQTPVSTTPDGKGGVAHFSLSPGSTKTLASVITSLISALPQRYKELRTGMDASGLVPHTKVYLSQYPAFSYGNGDTVCGAWPVITAGFPTLASPLPQSVWAWFSGVSRGLNNAVKAGAAAQGWHLIAVPEGLFYGHGYCASNSWFVAILTQLPALLTHGSPYNANGLFHPTVRGAHVSAVMALKQLCPLLANAARCRAFPTP